MDELEQLIEKIESLGSDVIFSGFAALGSRFMSTDSDGQLIYNKSAHILAFKALTDAYDELAEPESDDPPADDLRREIDGLTGPGGGQ